MDDVTALLDTYRECVRHLWNTYFAPGARGETNWDSVDDFRTASASLFRALVLRTLGYDEAEAYPVEEFGQEPLAFLRIELDPRGDIHINRERAGGYWDHPLARVEKGDLELTFLGYFDWSVTDHRDFAYYRTRIIGSTKYPGVVGKDALVPIGPHVRVLCQRAAQQGPAADGQR